MAFEIECGACGHRLMVDDDAQFADCSACESRLEVPGEHAPAGESSIARAIPPEEPAEEGNSAGEETGEKSESAFPGLPGPASDIVADMPAITDLPEQADAADSSEMPEFTGVDLPGEETREDTLDDLGELPDLGGDAGEETVEFSPESMAALSATEAATDLTPEEIVPPESVAAAMQPRGVPRYLFILVVGYASAVTIALIFLVWKFKLLGGRIDLPDVDPKPFGYVVPEESKMPWGHTLRLGETRRFGNLEITPSRVSRGRLVFRDEERDEEDEGRADVLKLWLKIRNVSHDQTVTPFGRKLMTMRHNTDHRGNTFVCREEDKTRDGRRILPYPLDTWDDGVVLKGQQVDRRLKPGEEFETYIATDEDEHLSKLNGALIWRVHFRKGYNPESGNGVTTLIEVAFHSAAIEDE